MWNKDMNHVWENTKQEKQGWTENDVNGELEQQSQK